jgi:hypothetical protein
MQCNPYLTVLRGRSINNNTAIRLFDPALGPFTGLASSAQEIRLRRNKGMGWHSFKRYRKTWLCGRRCFEDISNFWMAHKPQSHNQCRNSIRI